MALKLEIKDRDAAGRICKIHTEKSTITTPNLMPVINPNKMLITPKEMKKLFGTEIVITNSYIIKKDSKLKDKALKNGVHKLINFDGPIMTDSGTFQSYVYGDLDIDPIEIVEFQRDIGSDIGTILDIFGTPGQTKNQASDGIKKTIERAKKSIKVKKGMNLACTIQGSIYPDLRTKCAEKLSQIDTDFFAIGGVVPLMEKQRYSDLVEIIIASKKGLDPSKPVHLFGAGHPLIFPIAVALGCDLFDSSAYMKYANDDRMIFPWGTEKIENIKEIPCFCPICSKYSTTEFKKLEKKQRTIEIAKHNLYISFTEIKKIRNAISNGNLWELIERRANSNPYLMDALNLLRCENNKRFLEIFESISKDKALFYTGSQTIHRPIIYRIHNRLLSRYKPRYDTTVVFPEGKKPYSNFYSEQIKKIFEKNPRINILIASALGPAPLELDEMYPFAQSLFPNLLDNETESYITQIWDVFIKGKKVIFWKNNETLKYIEKGPDEKINFDLAKISSVIDMQFGKGIGSILLDGKIRFVKSKKTGKIRNIFCDDEHILSMRATDGLFTLKIKGGTKIQKSKTSPQLRVIVEDDAVPFIREGKSVFAKFVVDCDPGLRPLDECLIVDRKDNLLGVGRCIMNRLEMFSFNYGMAVKTRDHIT